MRALKVAIQMLIHLECRDVIPFDYSARRGMVDMSLLPFEPIRSPFGAFDPMAKKPHRRVHDAWEKLIEQRDRFEDENSIKFKM